MPFDYSSLAKIATSQIVDKGRTVSYNSICVAEYNPGTDELQGAIETTYSVSAVFLNYSKQNIVDSLVKADDKRVLIAKQDDFTPKTNDTITDADVIYRVMSVRVLEYGDGVVLYELQARR